MLNNKQSICAVLGAAALIALPVLVGVCSNNESKVKPSTSISKIDKNGHINQASKQGAQQIFDEMSVCISNQNLSKAFQLAKQSVKLYPRDPVTPWCVYRGAEAQYYLGHKNISKAWIAKASGMKSLVKAADRRKFSARLALMECCIARDSKDNAQFFNHLYQVFDQEDSEVIFDALKTFSTDFYTLHGRAASPDSFNYNRVKASGKHKAYAAVLFGIGALNKDLTVSYAESFFKAAEKFAPKSPMISAGRILATETVDIHRSSDNDPATYARLVKMLKAVAETSPSQEMRLIACNKMLNYKYMVPNASWAKGEIVKILDKNPELGTCELYCELGLEAMNANDNNDALKYYEKAAAMPENYWTHEALSHLADIFLERLHDQQKARECYLQLISLGDRYPEGTFDGYFKLSNLELSLGEYDLAMKHARQLYVWGDKTIKRYHMTTDVGGYYRRSTVDKLCNQIAREKAYTQKIKSNKQL